MKKWNYEKHEYEPYSVPEDWNCAISADMEAEVNCAGCGQKLKSGYESYTSFEIHNPGGFGYAVCRKCSREELSRKLQAESLR